MKLRISSHKLYSNTNFEEDSEKNEDYNVISITNSIIDNLYENDMPFD